MAQIVNNGMPIQIQVDAQNIAPANVAPAPAPAGGIGVAGAAAGARGPVQNFGAARAAGQQRVPEPARADVAANVAEGKCAKISRWFKEGTLSMRRTGGLPPTVRINVGTADDPKNISYKNTELASMINCLPRLQRAAAREALPQLLATRMNHGQELARAVLNATIEAPASLQDVADVMLFLNGKSHAQGVGFSEGAFSVEDSQGRLYDFLNTSPDKYLRSSTHLSSQQGATIGVHPNAHTNVHRGIDFPKGAEQGLPTGKRTVLFCAIPEANGQARRIFMKPESHGCRLSTLSGANRLAGKDNSPERPVNWKKDLGQFFGHAGGAIASIARKIFHIEVAGARKERIPSAVKEAFKSLVEHAPDRATRDTLKANNPTDDAQGIRTMLANIQSAMEALPAGASRNNLATMVKNFTDTLGSSLLDARHAQNRIGNEVLFDADEIQAGMQDDNPIETTAKGNQGLLRDALTHPTDAQKVILSGISSSFQLQAMAALPELQTALTSFTQVNREDALSVDRAIHTLYDTVGTMLQRVDESIDDVIKFTEKTLQLASSTMDQESLGDIYALLSTPKAIRERSEMQLCIQSVANGAEGDDTLTMLAGIAGRMSTYLPATVSGIEHALNMPAEDHLPIQTSLSQLLHQANMDIITPRPQLAADGTPVLAEDGTPLNIGIKANGIASIFVADCIERSGQLIVTGANLGETGRPQALKTEQSVIDAIPNPAMRAAVTSLASQTTNGLFAKILNATGVHSPTHGFVVATGADGNGTRNYSFNPETGVFTSLVKDTLDFIMPQGQEHIELRPKSGNYEGSRISYEFSCKLLQDENGSVFIEERSVRPREGRRDEVLTKGTEAFMDTGWIKQSN